jgi:hypothetical protein
MERYISRHTRACMLHAGMELLRCHFVLGLEAVKAIHNKAIIIDQTYRKLKPNMVIHNRCSEATNRHGINGDSEEVGFLHSHRRENLRSYIREIVKRCMVSKRHVFICN